MLIKGVIAFYWDYTRINHLYADKVTPYYNLLFNKYNKIINSYLLNV